MPKSNDFDKLMQFIDDRADLSEDELLSELEKQFTKETIDAFTAAMTGMRQRPKDKKPKR